MMRSYSRFAILFAGPIVLATWILSGKCVGQDESPTYATHIMPVLRAKCLKCHSDETRKSDLSLATPDGLLRGGESGPAIVPHSPDMSLLYKRILAGDMPPEDEARLTEAEIQLIRSWIESGAEMTKGSSETDGPSHNLGQHEVVPILLRHCAPCHGRHRQEADLDLRSKDAMLRGGKSGPAIQLGAAEESLVIRKIRSGEMPPHSRLVEVSVKPLEAPAIETLAKWIADGAPEVEDSHEMETQQPDPLVSETDRDFWSFKPPAKVEIPRVRDGKQVLNPIDAFIIRELERAGLELSPEADRYTLIRRASIDLTGLPPKPADVAAFLKDNEPGAYERLIDRLLSSPRYGERWGRYWLDLAGYADSEGKREQDLPRPHAWRYRDYVIRSFDSDKPFDRFLLEQLAGDELTDYEHAPEITDEIYDNLVATGFLRMAPDATWANITGYVADRLEVIADEIDILGSSVMGLTLKCARCHSHKFDPIPQRDYYRLTAIFKGAYDEYDWLKPDVRPGIGPVSQDGLSGRLLPLVTSAERRKWEMREAQLASEIQTAKENSQMDRVAALEAQRQPEPRIQALWDRGEPTPTYIYRRGDPLNPTKPVGPGVPAVLTSAQDSWEVSPPWPGAKQTGRRLAFAKWITQAEHPLTARVQVNHIWRRHFGAGIVRTVGNFGKTGAAPTHPELLDWLAREFVREGWSVKAIQRLIMTSATYRQSSEVRESHARDHQNILLSRMPLTRLDAEALYDSMLLIAGRLVDSQFGPADAIEVRADGLITPSKTSGGWRRLIYVRQPRKTVATHLENFDFPQMNPNCVERRESMTAPQALHLMNNGMVFKLAEHFAARVIDEAGSDPGFQVETAFLIAIGRPPSDEERMTLMSAFSEARNHFLIQTPISKDNPRKALTVVCHAILNSAGLLYVD